MGNIPADAKHWDSGDWIEWHRNKTGLDDRPCAAAAEDDTLARLTALHVSLLRSAKSYHMLTGHHLPVYGQIAQTHAAIHCDLPMAGPDRTCEETRVELLHLAPHGPDNVVEVDLTQNFVTLIVVRINDNFTCDARMIQRGGLPDDGNTAHKLCWQELPHKL
ncbi:MAG: hypothetical protein AB8B62_10800 [Roseobacter sp.]